MSPWPAASSTTSPKTTKRCSTTCADTFPISRRAHGRIRRRGPPMKPPNRGNRRVYNMRDVLDVVFDRPDWFEVQPKFGRAIICALAHLGGHPVAVVANQPNVL